MAPRIAKFAAGFVGGTIAEVVILAAGWKYYTKDTQFVPFTSSAPDFSTPIARKLNPFSNPPVLSDHAVRTVLLSQLRTTDTAELTTDFCRGVWSGYGFALQRLYLARKYKHLNGRETHLWEKDELKTSQYPVGTTLTDHFEVVDRTPEKVTVRCGDSPLIREPRPSDGMFSIEVTKDEAAGTATFHLKSIFVNTSADGSKADPLPPNFVWAHQEYTKLWMESSVRSLLK